MEHQTAYLEGPGLFYVRTRGRSSTGGFRRYFEELLADPRVRPGALILADHRALEYSLPRSGSSEVKELVDILKPHVGRVREVRIVSIVASTLQFGMTRMWESLNEVSEVPLDHLVTQDVDEALAHLGLPPAIMVELEARLDSEAEPMQDLPLQ